MLIVQLALLNVFIIVCAYFLLPESLIAFIFISLLIAALAYFRLKVFYRQHHQVTKALGDGLRNLQDGDFSITLVSQKLSNSNKNNELINLFNQVSEKLRLEKQSLYQRELLLDKVVNASDVVTVLVNHRDCIIFANLAGKQFFDEPALLGSSWSGLLADKMPQLIQHHDKNNAIIQLLLPEININSNNKKEGFTETEQSWHLSKHHLNLHGSPHQLILLKLLTKELHKQELETWKKVIRVINHELNNSIAPISSMCHSGNILAGRLNEPQLLKVFSTISGRINKLAEFIQNYSQLARLSTPQKQSFDIVNTVNELQSLYRFTLECSLNQILLNADQSQIEQLLINLLKNAQQSCDDKASVVNISSDQKQLMIVIRDFGSGMSQEVMSKAFLPYYSTKSDGSGIGLSICREIIDGHQGQVTLSNHTEGGLQVFISLPVT
jgi:nitrogen fixation/metabolism regulation signal transduction histidine kinase